MFLLLYLFSYLFSWVYSSGIVLVVDMINTNNEKITQLKPIFSSIIFPSLLLIINSFSMKQLRHTTIELRIYINQPKIRSPRLLWLLRVSPVLLPHQVEFLRIFIIMIGKIFSLLVNNQWICIQRCLPTVTNWIMNIRIIIRIISIMANVIHMMLLSNKTISTPFDLFCLDVFSLPLFILCHFRFSSSHFFFYVSTHDLLARVFDTIFDPYRFSFFLVDDIHEKITTRQTRSKDRMIDFFAVRRCQCEIWVVLGVVYTLDGYLATIDKHLRGKKTCNVRLL